MVQWGDFQELAEAFPESKFYLATTKCERTYTDVSYQNDDFVVFGKETKGLATEILDMFPDSHIRIPMLDIGRSLNLSNAAAIILFEALRQQGFSGLR